MNTITWSDNINDNTKIIEFLTKFKNLKITTEEKFIDENLDEELSIKFNCENNLITCHSSDAEYHGFDVEIYDDGVYISGHRDYENEFTEDEQFKMFGETVLNLCKINN